jgi:hypothetical protein
VDRIGADHTAAEAGFPCARVNRHDFSGESAQAVAKSLQVGLQELGRLDRFGGR